MMEGVQGEAKHSNRYPVLDIVRFVAALMVILLHIFPEGSTAEMIGLDHSIPNLLLLSLADAMLRTAVPVFFLISGFLLFKRIEEDPDNKWKYIGRLCLRLLFLGLFWLAVGLPLTIKDIAGLISQGDTHNLVRYIVISLWKGVPRGFWFLVSLALSVLLVGVVKTRKGFIALAVISGLMYAYGCLNAAYFGLLSGPFYAVGDYLELC